MRQYAAVVNQFIALLLRGFAALPLSWVQQWGVAMGYLLHWWPNRQRRNALINIALCFPELSPPQAIQLRRRALGELGKTYGEIAHFWYRPVPQVLALIREVRGGELLHNTNQRGLIVLSPHLGAWELAGLYLAAQRRTTIFYKPQQYGDALIRTARARTGATLAPISAAGLRLLMHTLIRGDAVGILPDQAPRADTGAIFAPFFLLPAYTMLLVQRLARRTHAPVVFLFAERLPAAQGYCVHCLPAPAGIDDADDETAAAALNAGIALCIQQCPAQYLWSYRRWRERPPHWPKLYTGGLSDQAALGTAQQLLTYYAATTRPS